MRQTAEARNVPDSDRPEQCDRPVLELDAAPLATFRSRRFASIQCNMDWPGSVDGGETTPGHEIDDVDPGFIERGNVLLYFLDVDGLA